MRLVGMWGLMRVGRIFSNLQISSTFLGLPADLMLEGKDQRELNQSHEERFTEGPDPDVCVVVGLSCLAGERDRPDETACRTSKGS